MKFYEFKGKYFDYYALICAKDKNEANKFYDEEVCDIEDVNNNAIEVSREYVDEQIIDYINSNKCVEDYAEIDAWLHGLEIAIEKEESYLILIDGSLI